MKKVLMLKKQSSSGGATFAPSYLSMTANIASTVKLQQTGSPTALTGLEYQINSGQWTQYTIDDTINLSQGDVLKWRAVTYNNTFCESTTDYYHFVMTGSIALDGDLLYLLHKSRVITQLPSYCFCYLFLSCPITSTAVHAPDTILSTGCYYGLYRGCTYLTWSRDLPVTTLAANCYQRIFYYSSLQIAPSLPAQTAKQDCYREMFAGCTELIQSPTIAITTDAGNCFLGMFNGCSKLQNAPEIHVTTSIGWDAFYLMFKDCTRLNYIKVHFTSWAHTSQWVQGVASVGTFECPVELTQTFDNSHIPTGWTVNTF